MEGDMCYWLYGNYIQQKSLCMSLSYGDSKVNYSVVLGSSDCYKCSNTLHIVLTLTFGILGGVVYVLMLFGLRLTIDLDKPKWFIFV